MKKINLILCACALAGSAFFASCKNNAQEINFVTSTSYENRYTISGTYQTVSADNYVSEAGVASTTNETRTNIYNISSGYARIYWTDSEAIKEGNYTTWYGVNIGNVRGTHQSKTDTGSVAGTLAPANPTEESIPLYWLQFYKIDDEFFYRTNDGEAVQVKVTGDLESGEDFSIVLEYKETVDNTGTIAATSKEVNETTTTTTYKIDFKAQ